MTFNCIGLLSLSHLSISLPRILLFVQNMEEVLPHTQWLQTNWEMLVNANIPAMKVADRLVSFGVYKPWHDDYQRIQTEPSASGKVHVLLETLRPKNAGAFKLFKEALAHFCPHVSTACVKPEDALTELSNATCKNYKTI